MNIKTTTREPAHLAGGAPRFHGGFQVNLVMAARRRRLRVSPHIATAPPSVS